LYYYVEARASDDLGTTAFYPAHAETGALVYRASSTDVARTDATPPSAKESSTTSIAINEVMAANTRTIKDPQGKFDDWIELVNSGSAEADLSGMYLTDDSNKPRKWKFPKGTSMKPGEHLLIWADEDGKDQPGLHANFKLSKNGETLLLVDSDERGNAVLDTVEFTSQRDDIAFGRHPDRDGKWQPVPPTPGQANVAN
jgi:hypothetical protein